MVWWLSYIIAWCQAFLLVDVHKFNLFPKWTSEHCGKELPMIFWAANRTGNRVTSFHMGCGWVCLFPLSTCAAEFGGNHCRLFSVNSQSFNCNTNHSSKTMVLQEVDLYSRNDSSLVLKKGYGRLSIVVCPVVLSHWFLFHPVLRRWSTLICASFSKSVGSTTN